MRTFARLSSLPILNAHILIVAELCSGETLPEVEIVSLLEEQIPRYKLRADTLTKFGGKCSFYIYNFPSLCHVVSMG